MSAKKIVTSLAVELKPSKLLQWFNIVVHALALAADVLTPIGLSLKIVLTLLIVADYWLNYRRFQQEFRQIHFSDQLGWQVSKKNLYTTVHIQPSTVITTWVIFLHTKELAPMVIAKDMLTDDEFRRLIVKLKINFNHN